MAELEEKSRAHQNMKNHPLGTMKNISKGYVSLDFLWLVIENKDWQTEEMRWHHAAEIKNSSSEKPQSQEEVNF